MAKTVKFEWDAAKDLENAWKHGVSFTEAALAFFDAQRIIAVDLRHSQDEERLYCYGRVDGGIMTVRFTYRGDRIRIYGAGYWRSGKAIYEKANQIH